MHQPNDQMLRLMIERANSFYKAKSPIPGIGFFEGIDLKNPQQRRGAILHSDVGVDDVSGLVKFAGTLRGLVWNLGATDAGILCGLNISVDKQPPEPSAVIYIDQKYGQMRVLVAPLTGEDLVFKDFGAVHPVINFFPELFSAESYGPAHAEA